MNKTQKARFAKAGWKLGTAADVLGMSDAEVALVEAKLRLGQQGPDGAPAEAPRRPPWRSS